MQALTTNILFLLVTIRSTQCLNNRKFPDHFMFGVGSAAYQTEGAWNEDGKGESIWDRFTHSPNNHVYKHQNGDIACDSYHKYKEDVALVKDLGVNHYRFSISWSRILPTGHNNIVNQAGITHYKNLIKELRVNGIEPMVTIYHWDTPQPLEDLGGWTNVIIVEKFVQYAKILFENLGKDVKYWQTINEPLQMCIQGYATGNKAPGKRLPGIGEYLCGHNMLKAHAEVWHLYDKHYRREQQGVVGITIDTRWLEPEFDTKIYKAVADRRQQFMFGWFANPVIKGDYPPIMKKLIANRSAVQGYNKSRLPEFTKKEIEYIKGATDYLGVNFFTSFMVGQVKDINITEVSWEADSETFVYQLDTWEQSTGTDWLKVTPWGIGELLNWIKTSYGNIPLFITENGYSDDGSTLEDQQRIEFFRHHLSNVRDAIDNGVNILGYTTWTLLDNFEWNMGYLEKFGLYHVDFTSPARTRTPKKSVNYYKYVARTKCIVDPPECVNQDEKLMKINSHRKNKKIEWDSTARYNSVLA